MRGAICVDMLSKLDSWDYLALVMLVLSLWLILGGAGKLKAANPEQVDEGKLKKPGQRGKQPPPPASGGLHRTGKGQAEPENLSRSGQAPGRAQSL